MSGPGDPLGARPPPARDVVVIVQARMGSTRLPGKVLEDVGGRPMLHRVMERVARARLPARCGIATTTHPRDDAVAAAARDLGVGLFRGSEDDVLARYLGAAGAFAAGAVVRVTADCPLVDPGILDRVVERLGVGDVDYASNTLERAWPRGLDVEAFTVEALERAAREAPPGPDREHVTLWMYRHPGAFRLAGIPADGDHAHHRWTVDTAEDLELVRRIYARLGPDGLFGWRGALALVESDPSLPAINAAVLQKGIGPLP
ncbi:glycosyltransferase family protein [Myxococcota bacterium]|nr:glycosyltransferase family protein [Myxococcota bacterium]